jgi:hypothetical protein
MSVESTRSIVQLQFRAEYWFDTHAGDSFCSLGLYCNKVIQHVTCQNHTHKCENHTQRDKIIRMSLKIIGIAASQNPIRFFLVIFG